MVINYFNISEFCIVKGQNIPQDVADAILVHHILPLNKCREKTEAPIYISQSSGYRPRSYEKSKGRSGNSQHTFEQVWPGGRGAVDVTAVDLQKLGVALMENTTYTRICYYPNKGFYHCDYKPVKGGKRAYYTNTPDGWAFRRWIEK